MHTGFPDTKNWLEKQRENARGMIAQFRVWQTAEPAHEEASHTKQACSSTREEEIYYASRHLLTHNGSESKDERLHVSLPQ